MAQSRGLRPAPADLAVAFLARLTAELGPRRIAEVGRLNAAETRPGICHSHDFCDANQVMIEAEESLGWEADLDDPADVELLNAAWEIALPRRS